MTMLDIIFVFGFWFAFFKLLSKINAYCRSQDKLRRPFIKFVFFQLMCALFVCSIAAFECLNNEISPFTLVCPPVVFIVILLGCLFEIYMNKRLYSNFLEIRKVGLLYFRLSALAPKEERKIDPQTLEAIQFTKKIYRALDKQDQRRFLVESVLN